MRLIRFLSSRIQFKIILPFAALTLAVALMGTYLSTNLFAGSLEERFSQQLTDAADGVADSLAQRELAHLAQIRSIAFTEGVNEAIRDGDLQTLQTVVLIEVTNNNIDRVDVVNRDGERLLTVRRFPGQNVATGYTTENERIDFITWPTVNHVLNTQPDDQGDKRVALSDMDGTPLFITAGPVRIEDEVVGAILVSTYMSDLLPTIERSVSTKISLYDADGRVLDSTIGNTPNIFSAINIPPTTVATLRNSSGSRSVQQSINIAESDYDMLPNIFWARGEILGFFSVAVETTGIIEESQNLRRTMFLIFGAAMVLVFGIGFITSNMITGRVQKLMENALAVAEGDLTRRTDLASYDEIGSLASSFNYMTTTLQKKIDELTALHESSTTITVQSGLNLQMVLDAVTSSIKELIPNTDQVVVHLLDEENQKLDLIASTSGQSDHFPSFRFERYGRLDNILTEARPQFIPFNEIERYSLNGHPFTYAHTNPQMLIVPLVNSQEAVGMISLTFNELAVGDNSAQFDEDNERLLGTFANQAAVAIKNAQLFETIQKAFEELRELDRLKTEFINIAAHELRTPLGSILGHASSAEKRAPPKLKKYVKFIVISAVRMRTMIDAMLTIQRLDAGTAFLKVRPTDIRKLIKKTVADYQPMAELEGHTIEMHLPEEPLTLEVDGEKLGLVFSNLISNAIKFTPEEGLIEITAQDQDQGILIAVRDTGIGLSLEDQKQVFERFYQVRPENMTSHQNLGVGAGHGGMGIGLTIVKNLVELHQGEVWLKSELNQGSTFFVRLPKQVAPRPVEQTMATIPASLPT